MYLFCITFSSFLVSPPGDATNFDVLKTLDELKTIPIVNACYEKFNARMTDNLIEIIGKLEKNHEKGVLQFVFLCVDVFCLPFIDI